MIMKNLSALCSDIISYNRPEKNKENLKLLYSTIDLTNLHSTATESDILKLCKNALRSNFQGITIPTVAAVCVYPVYVTQCKEALHNSALNIATVTGVFPHAQSFPEVKYLETEMAINHGATEIDIVIHLSAILNKNESLVFDEIKTIKQICGQHHLKVILETGLLEDNQLIEEASNMALESGADFIKTSTGKDGSTASVEAVYTMCQVIKDYYEKTGRKAGIKPAGGISTSDDALNYMAILNEVLGAEWLSPQLFRLGASRLADNLLHDIAELEKV
jgi:deoxyribose-phosphate aldolase